MAVSTSVLIIISFVNYPDSIRLKNINIKEILIGIGSAVFLYVVFYTGKLILDSINIIPHHNENISLVYANKGIFQGWVIALLLFFPVGFGEETVPTNVDPVSLVVHRLGNAADVAGHLKDNGENVRLFEQLERSRKASRTCADDNGMFFFRCHFRSGK